MKKAMLGLVLFLAALVAGGPLLAESTGEAWEVSWWTVDGGGGQSAGAGFAVTGTVGQPDAQGRAAGGDFAVSGGFWSAPATPPQPPTFVIYLPGAVLSAAQESASR